MAAYFRPTDLKQALELLRSVSGPRPVIMAGGTDYFPSRLGKPHADSILDLTAISSLRGVEELESGWRIGATTTWADIAEADLPPLFDGLRQAARLIGGAQVQNSGTVAGNICNASPAADGIPMLLAMRARVELRNLQGRREMALADFISGNRRTLLQPDEILAGILIPKPRYPARSIFLKLGARSYLVISIAMVGVVLEADADVVHAAGVAVGACSAVAQRLTLLETDLIGRRVNAGLANKVQAQHFAELSPIDDVRADAGYRQEAAVILTRRALARLGGTEG